MFNVDVGVDGDDDDDEVKLGRREENEEVRGAIGEGPPMEEVDGKIHEVTGATVTEEAANKENTNDEGLRRASILE